MLRSRAEDVPDLVSVNTVSLERLAEVADRDEERWEWGGGGDFFYAFEQICPYFTLCVHS